MTANAPVCMTEEYWANSQLSIARYYGRVRFCGHEYYIVDKQGRDIWECSAIAKRNGSDKAIPAGEPCDLVRKDFITFYRKLGREKFLAVLKDHLRTDDKDLKAIYKESTSGKEVSSMILDLPLKKEWYNMIESGIKKEEYREIKPYWCNRLLYGVPLGVNEYWKTVLEKTFNAIKEHSERLPKSFNLEHLLIWQYGTRGYTHVRFRYGYTQRVMLYKIDEIIIGRGNPNWGAPTDKDVFIIKFSYL